MSPKHISSDPGSASVTDDSDSMTDVEPDDTQTEVAPATNTKSKNTGRASKKDPMQPGGGQKKEDMKQLKKANRKNSGGKSGRAHGDSLSNSQGNMDRPRLVTGSASDVPDNAEKQKPKGSSLTADHSSDKPANVVVKRKTGSSTGMGKRQAADVIGLKATAAKVEHYKSPKSVAEKKKSSESGDMSTMEKSDGAESPETDAAGSVNVSAASLMKAETQKGQRAYEDKNYSAKNEATNASSSVDDKSSKDKQQSATHSVIGVPAKRKASNSEADDDDDDAECSSQLDVSGFKQQALDSISPAKSQKLQQSYTAESLADDNHMDMTSNSNSVISQPLTSSLKLDGGIGKRGRSTSRRHYANVGNRAPSASDTPHLVEGGLSVMRGRGRGRPRGSSGVPFTHQQGMGASAGPYGARGATSARRVQHGGMPVRARGGMPVRARGRMHVVGGLPHRPTETMLVRNSTSGSGDGTSYGESHEPRTLMTGTAVQNMPVFKPVMNSANANCGERFTLCYVIIDLSK